MSRSPNAHLMACAYPGVQAMSADTAHTFGRHTHDQYGIGRIARGAQRSLSGRGMVEAVAGDIITVNPQEVHDGIALGEGGRHWHMLYIEPVVLQALAQDIREGAGRGCVEWTEPVVRHRPLAAGFDVALLRLTTEPASDAGLAAEEALLSLLAALIQPAPARPASRQHVGLQRAMACIDEDPGAAHTLAALAAEAGMSRYALVRSFARATGLTPHAYVVQRRLQQARRLITQGQALSEAALASGFADQSHLTRLFVRHYGLTPAAYARACR
jgi:AraC-like DNA-binding protein